MIKVPPGVPVVKVVQVHLTAMGEGGVPDIMTQSNGLNEVQIQIQSPADGTGDPGYQLHMQAASGDIIVADQRKHLGLVGVAVVVGAVHDPVDVLGELGTPDRSGSQVAFPAEGHNIGEGTIHVGPVPLFSFDSLG